MIIKILKNYFELKRENKEELKRFDQVIEDHDIDFDEDAIDADAYELTPENIKWIMDVHGIDQGTAESFLSVMNFLNSPDSPAILNLAGHLKKWRQSIQFLIIL